MVPTLRRCGVDPYAVFHRQFDRLLSDTFGDAGVEPQAGYPVDIRENKDELVVEAELPGFKKDEVEITTDQGVLTIKAERRVEKTEGNSGGESGDEHHLQERRYTRVARSFRLPSTVDTTQVDASLADGVLTLKLPKREEVKPRKIEVK